jgi:lysophospholipase L1-like esterase
MNKIINISLLLITILPLLPTSLHAQTDEEDTTPSGQSTISFAIDSLCIVSDPQRTLTPFYNELSALEEGKDTVINIVHIGDSHIQAGYLSGQTMRMLQSRYGNAGRGWISPLRIARTNEPDDYFIRTLVKKWTIGRCVQLHPPCDTGIGGIGIQTESPFVNFDIIMTPINGAGYSYNNIVAYRGAKSMPLLPTAILRDSSQVTEGTFNNLKLATDTIQLPHLTDSLQLQTTRRKAGTDTLLPASSFNNLYFGFNLSNGHPGILYHSIGINGAMFANYAKETYIRRLALLRPSLIIFSLGTNESFAGRFNTEDFTNEVETCIRLVKKHLPNTAILLVTPPECFKRATINKKRVYLRNDNIIKIAQTLVRLADKHNLACWDFFRATGGHNSSDNWLKGNFMSRDRIHFTKEAYRRQGQLLYQALINGPNNQHE